MRYPLIAGLLLCGLFAAAQPPPGARGAKLDGPLLRIPSRHAGAEGVWVRVSPPRQPRYTKGAPVAIHVPGGLGPGGVGTAPARLGDYGFVDIVFLFPGGESGPPQDGKPVRSGGTYDSRGPASVRALADVILFATGRLKSTEGKTIQEYLPGTRVLTDQVGLIGWSLGGTTVAAALGLHGKELRGVAWYASHESPYGEGVIDGEFGTHNQPSRFYDANAGRLDLAGLKYGPGVPALMMGRPVPGAEGLRGALYLDGNGDGKFDAERDFAFSGMFLPGPGPKIYYSPMLTRAAIEKKLFPAAWPAHIATLRQTEEAWRIRDGVSNIAAAVKNIPDLAVVVFAGAKDHVQATADHRHILLQYSGFQDAGVRWIRLNPDARYVEMVLGRKPPREVQNPANARFDRRNIRGAVMPEPPEGGPSDHQALTAAACELADRTMKKEWGPVLQAVLVSPSARKPAGKQPRIAVVFNMHLDPVAAPGPERKRAELLRRRENMIWLQGVIQALPPDQRPILNIQMSGGHAEFFLEDERAFEMIRRYHQQGHRLGTHFHRNIYLGKPLDWIDLRPSRPIAKPQLGPGEVLTPGIIPEPNTLDEVRRLWKDNFRFTEPLIAKVTGLDAAGVKKINNHGEFHLPNSMEWKDVLFKEFGLTVETGGRNELFNMIFDHDVHNAWRPSAKEELGEDVHNRAYVCVPQVAVPGNIKPHQGVRQDLSIPAMQRRFLQIVMERREHERMGLPPKTWTYGWTLHDFDINPAEAVRGPNHSQRKNVQELVAWINANFVPEVAYWDTPEGVANVFYEQEARQPDVPQFHYSSRKRDWDAYPYRMKGAAQALLGSHYTRTLPDWREQGVRAFELERVKPGSEWYEDANAEAKVKGSTSRLVLAWSEAGPRTIDLSRMSAGDLKLIRGVSGERSVVKASAVPVGEEPVVIEFE